MMRTMGFANGFNIKEETPRSLVVETLVDGERFTENEFCINSPEEKETIIAKYLADMMYNLDVEREMAQQERERLAKKIMGLNIITGYKIVVDGEDPEKNTKILEVELLKNGKSYAGSGRKEVTNEEYEALKTRLNDCIRHNLDVRHQIRSIWMVEILAII